ncbi:unnamed protein product [Caenorhabditis angaria]|uniref:Uncharacterized protein n=1 Tax=Caenorhabditis angaria TaxID=860376 RepID=A0A9P1I7I5_9PELO|nr:unnamed protein product [Caenorhabditis angaria]
MLNNRHSCRSVVKLLRDELARNRRRISDENNQALAIFFSEQFAMNQRRISLSRVRRRFITSLSFKHRNRHQLSAKQRSLQCVQ